MVENKEKTNESQSVVSDRRARRKAKRGETVTRASYDASSDSQQVDDEVNSYTEGKGVATRSQREALKERVKESQGTGEGIPILGRVIAYFRDVVAEVQKVTWPTREESRRLTLIVIAVTTFFALFLGGIDLFYGWWFQEGLASTGTFLLVATGVAILSGSLYYMAFIKKPVS